MKNEETPECVDPKRFGSHDFGDGNTNDCAYGCGCYMGPYCSGGLVDPHGACPNNPLPKPEEDETVNETPVDDMTSDLPTKPGVYMSCYPGCPVREVLVWENMTPREKPYLQFGPDHAGNSRKVSQSEVGRLWSGPLAVGEPWPENYYTSELPTEAGCCYGTKDGLDGEPKLAFVYHIGDDTGVYVVNNECMDVLRSEPVGRLWTRYPIATAADLAGVEDEPAVDPVEEFRASVEGPFEARVANGGGWIATAPLQNGARRAFPATDEEHVIILCAALNAWTGHTGEAKDAASEHPDDRAKAAMGIPY